MSDCVVIGIGNPIMRDDGVGIHVVRSLKGMVPDDVELIEGSVNAPDLLLFLENRRMAIFIDAIDAGEEPGSIFRFSPEDVRKRSGAASISLHDFGLYELITAAKLLDQCPELITIIAVQVKSVEPGEELSAELEEAIPKICDVVVQEISKYPADEIPEG